MTTVTQVVSGNVGIQTQVVLLKGLFLKPLRYITSASPGTLRIDLIAGVVGNGNWERGRKASGLVSPTVKCTFWTPAAACVLVFLPQGPGKIFHSPCKEADLSLDEREPLPACLQTAVSASSCLRTPTETALIIA